MKLLTLPIMLAFAWEVRGQLRLAVCLTQGIYDENAYGLGFFAAISIASNDVRLYLNGFTIEKSVGHALMQRFFALIELADAPFIKNTGPAQFVGDEFAPCSMVQIRGPGTLGRLSHHGIHGNENGHVVIQDVTFRDFEVAAVSLNNVDCLTIKDCTVLHNRQDVPVVGMFAAARFIRPYGKALKEMDYRMNLRGVITTAAELYDNLIASINNVFQDVISDGFINPTTHPDEYRLFNNPFRVIDGPCYAFLVHGKGPAVGGQGLRGVITTAAELYDNLIASINNVFQDVISDGFINPTTHPDEYRLFNNPFRVIDGPCYAFLVHGKGPAVGGQGLLFNEADATKTSSNVFIRGNKISSINCWNNEVPAAVGTTARVDGAVSNDARGAVFQFVSTYDTLDPYLAINADGTYRGNVVADMPIMVAKAIQEGVLTDTSLLQTGVNTINAEQVAWASSGSAVYEPIYRCNGDAMNHNNKGIIIIQMEGTRGFSIKGNSIQDVENLSVAPYSNCLGGYHAGASLENLGEQQAANIRGISVAAVRGYSSCQQSEIEKNVISNMDSDHANVIIGIDVQGDSAGVAVNGNSVDLKAGVKQNTQDPYIALRVREYTDKSGIVVGNNMLAQEQQILNDCHLRSLKEVPHGHMSGDIEWGHGGCPFAHAGMGKHKGL